jgi:DNA polymerase zeta
MMAPKYGERMKYFVINGGLTAIKNRSISVFEYLQNKNMSLDLEYYLRKQVVPPLQRVLSSLADLN